MSDSNQIKYAKTHEWVRLEGENEAVIGISDYAQNSLGDITFVELPAAGDRLSKGDSFGVVESVKAASDLYAPVNGEVIAVNEELEDAPEKVNDSATGDGWMLRVRLDDPGDLNDLMDEGEYQSANS